jgi:hypothetical protein
MLKIFFEAFSGPRIKPIFLYFFSIIFGGLIFFNYSQVFGWISADYEPVYVGYSQTIFHPDHMARVMYWGESILLPIIANLIGASKSKTTFFFLCSFIYLLLFPVFSYLALEKFKSASRALLFIFLLGVSYLINGGGSPDSLIILLMGVAALSNSPLVIFISVMLSCLAHFSLTFIAVVGLIPLIYFSPYNSKSTSFKVIGTLVAALIIGRLLLELWFWKFDYLHANGRIKYVIDLGFEFFKLRYLKNPSEFWLAPNIFFLTTFGVVALYFACLWRVGFCLAALFGLCLAYTAMFFTVDGHRIFAVAISGPWIYFLSTFVGSLNAPSSEA